jgi:hypothetical protein
MFSNEPGRLILFSPGGGYGNAGMRPDLEAGMAGDGVALRNRMAATRHKWITFAAGVLLVACSAALWLIYVANGIAYGSIVGLSGRSADLKTLGFRAEVSLAAAVVVQVIGVGLITRPLSARLAAVEDRIILRASFPLAIGLVSAMVVFVLLRGL